MKNDKGMLSTRYPKHASGLRPTAVISFAAMVLLAATLAACGTSGTSEAAARTTAATDGAALFEDLGCIGCHALDGRGRGPSLASLSGQTISLENGQAVTADEQYIRASILTPGAQTRAGYQPIMPAYDGLINDEELSALVNYVLSLNGGN